MPEGKIILALPPPARVLLFVLQVFFALSLRVGSGDEIREGARGVVRISRAREFDAYPATRNFSRGTDGYTVLDRKEVAWCMRDSRRLGGERIQDDGAQEAKRVRKRNLYDAVGTFAGILFCIRVLRVDRTGGRRRIRWGVPEGRFGGRCSTFFWGWGDELEAEGDVFGKWGGFGESEVVHSPFKAKRVRG